MADGQTTASDAQKTVVAFIAGLLIGGLLVWAFGGTPEETPADEANGTDSEETTDDNGAADEDADNDTATDTDDQTSTDAADDEANADDAEGSADVADQAAGTTVQITGAVFPTDEGWIGVREMTNGEMGSLLGVARYSKEQGLIPTEIKLLRGTTAGNEYAVVFYSDNGDREFNLANDTQIEQAGTFTAQ